MELHATPSPFLKSSSKKYTKPIKPVIVEQTTTYLVLAAQHLTDSISAN